jgi:steroid delta-isomerase-like uncharacterized protein
MSPQEKELFMPGDENKAVVRRFVDEVLNKGNFRVMDEVVAPEFVNHTTRAGFPPTRESTKEQLAMYRSAFPDMRTTVEDMVVEGDRVVSRWTAQGTHQGELMGVPPTGKRVTVSGVDITRVASGKIVEHWEYWDQLELLQQIGAVPAPRLFARV